MDCSRGLIASLLVPALSFVAFATDGIAVSMRVDSSTGWQNNGLCCTGYPDFGRIHVYQIRNDQVISDKVLDNNPNPCSRWATLSVSGTQCAFFRQVIGPNGGGGYEAKQLYISVINIDGTNRRDLVDLKAQGGNGSGYMDWPRGDWIYYNLGGNGEDNSRFIWRVNVSTGAKELVATLPYKIWIWSMSTNADRMTARQNDKAAGCVNEILRFPFPSGASTSCASASIVYGQGCTNSISPSGEVLYYTTDAGHAIYAIGNWQSSQSATIMSYVDFNAWAINANSIKMNCTDGKTYTVGLGCEENRYSANSDKWFCFHVGWQPSGRFYGCGGNQVLINWQDKKTIMVSFNPFVCTGYDANKQSFCPDAFTAAHKRTQEAGDFVVTGPESEINADLRQYVTGGTASRHAQARAQLAGADVLRPEEGIVTIQFEDNAFHEVRIHEMGGRLVARRRGNALTERIPVGAGARGIHTAHITIGSRTSVRNVMPW